jgi:UDP-N-acetyl-D-galactosamine dehydrogenase
MIAAGFHVKGEPVIVFGLTFKEDVPDLRNSKVIDVIRELQSYGAEVIVHDPVADPDEAMHEYGLKLTAWEDLPKAGAAVAAVGHAKLRERGLKAMAGKLAPGAVLADVKSAFDPAEVAAAGLRLWRL